LRPANQESVSATAKVDAGSQVFSVEFLNDYYDPNLAQDRNLIIDWVEVEGPIGAIGINPIREKIVICDLNTGVDCVRQVIEKFGERAFRRPLSAAEIDRILPLVDLAKAQGQTVEVGVEIALRAMLTSPHFLFRPELDANPNATTSHALNDYELASRLSYFIWSSMPDAELFAAAREGKLQDPAQIEAEVERMLADPKSDALIDNFAGQWLFTRASDAHQPDCYAFTTGDKDLT